jgi:hypothetical protein
MARFKKDEVAQNALAHTVKLADVKGDVYDTVFPVGGHDPMWDLAESTVSIALIESFYNPASWWRWLPLPWCPLSGYVNGAPLVKGKRVTGFTNGQIGSHFPLSMAA